MGTLITFYSYKGGVGRTMALANVAALLAQWGKKVLVIDWDLEAPGVEHFFFQEQADELSRIQQQGGLIDLLTELQEGKATVDNWRKFLIESNIPKTSSSVALLTAGARKQAYFRSVRRLDVKEFYEEKNGGYIIEALRTQWRSEFDFVLVDSRTGVTDIGGICTIQLPDILVLVFTATWQSLTGAVRIASDAAENRQQLPFDRPQVPILPLPSRFDTQTEHKVAQEWLERFENSLVSFYDAWLPTGISRRDFLTATKIPYTPYFSFGEGLPVIEQGTADPTGLGFAYETVAALLANRLLHSDLVLQNRDELIRIARFPSELPRIPLRELPHSTVMLVQSSGAGTDPIASSTSKKFQALIANHVEKQGGQLAESDGRSFLFGFNDPEHALLCAIAIQESLMIRSPLAGPAGPLKVRISIHADGHPALKDRMSQLREIAFLISGRAKEDEILISEDAKKLINQPLPNIDYYDKKNSIERPVKPQSFQLEPEPPLLRIFDVVYEIPVDLEPDELSALKEQDPQSRAGGGFQALLVSLQEKVTNGILKLSLSDRERIARYAHDYKSGGWQGRLKTIFGRTLGDNLGREV
jgi:cellulose biosynthesis protein BcsQ